MTSRLTVEEKYANPDVVEFWQQLGKQGLQQAEQQMIDRYFPQTGHLLDIGCGAGRAMLALGRQGYAATGIDLSLSMLQAGRHLSPEMRLAGANLLTLPFDDHSFTAAFMFFGALQHIPGRRQRQQAIAEMARIVQPGGRLILGLDNLAPALFCYAYWVKEKLLGRSPQQTSEPPIDTNADTTLWARNHHPLVWHLRGVARTLRWRTWPAIIDITRFIFGSPNGLEPGDTQVAQFSQPPTSGFVYYHIYRVEEMVEDAALAGWQLLGYHTGRELSEKTTYPPSIKARDKQLFFAFQK